MPVIINCPCCGNDIKLSLAYWDTGGESVPIACPNCKTQLKVSLETGFLKKVEIVGECKE